MDLMARAVDRIFDPSAVRLSFYANRTTMSNLRIQARKESSNVLSVESGLNQFGKTIHTLTYLGVPIRMMDTLILTESQVV